MTHGSRLKWGKSLGVDMHQPGKVGLATASLHRSYGHDVHFANWPWSTRGWETSKGCTPKCWRVRLLDCWVVAKRILRKNYSLWPRWLHTLVMSRVSRCFVSAAHLLFVGPFPFVARPESLNLAIVNQSDHPTKPIRVWIEVFHIPNRWLKTRNGRFLLGPLVPHCAKTGYCTPHLLY
jgi:hypothetical protein